MKPLCVDASWSQMFTRRLEELAAVEHLDSGHPGVAGFRSDDVVLAAATHQGPVRICLQHMYLWVRARIKVAVIKKRRRAHHGAGDLGHIDHAHWTELCQLAGGHTSSVADDESAVVVVREQGRQGGA